MATKTLPFLLSAANNPKTFFPVFGGTHGGLLDEGGDELFACIKRFVGV
jgi:hypothetical protein